MKIRDNVITGPGSYLAFMIVVMALVFSVKVSAQSAEIITADNLISTQSNSIQVMHYAPEEVEKKNREALNSIISVYFDQVPMKEALHEIADLGGLKLAYSRDLEEEIWNAPVTLRLQRATVLGAFYAVMDDTDLRLTLSSNSDAGQIVVKKGSVQEILPDETTLLYALQESVQGQVIEASTSEPLPGVNIVFQGTNIGTVTDANGRYQLDIPSLDGTLVISYIGYESQTVPIQGRTSIDISLRSEVLHGEEMIVTAFGIAREEKSLTYSTQHVSTEQLTQARELNILTGLQGKIAGMSINTNSTGVGAGSRVVLRGNRSISGDSQPLYVIDGVPVREQPSNLTPDNIASINVLKGPNAAALYGSDAQNGAIVIETMKGQAGQVNISLQNNFQVGIPDLIEQQNTYGQGSMGIYSRSSEESWGPEMNGQMVQHWSNNPDIASTEYAFTPQPDNVRDILQNSYNMSTNILASMGSEAIQGVLSFTRTDARGIIPRNDLARNNLSLRITSQVTDWLEVDSKLEYAEQTINNPLRTGDNADFNPYRIIYNLPRNIQTEHMADYEFIDDNNLPRQHFWSPGSTESRNPYWMINRNLTEQNEDRVLGLLALTFNITDAINFRARTSYDGATRGSENKIYNDTFVHYTNGYYAITRSDAEEWNADGLITYMDDLSSDFSLEANIGASIQTRGNTSLSANVDRGQGLIIPNFFNLDNTNIRHYNYNSGQPRETQSLFAFGQLGWRDLVYLDVSGRNDWSSTLPSGNRSFFYPSAGLSIILSDMIDLPGQMDFARVRVSYAKVGNSAPAQMLYRSLNYSSGGNEGFLQLSSTLPNPNLHPEETESYEAGFDLRFYEGRVGLDVTAYKTNTFNQLFTITLPPGSGASEYFTNGGDVENRGIEILLSTRPIQTIQQSLDLDFNFSTNRNWVNKISDERPRVVIGSDGVLRDMVVEQGEEFGNVYTNGWLRDNQGRVIVNSNGLPRITSGRVVNVANFNPDWQLSLSSTYSYGNITASFLIEHRQGGSMVSHTDAILYGEGNAVETLKGRDGGLVFGENVYSNETAVLDDGSPNNIEVDSETLWKHLGGRLVGSGEAFVEETTNTRLREVVLGYNLPQSMIEGLPISNLRISLVGRNLLFLYKPGRWDPDFLVAEDTSAPGLQMFGPPTTRTFGANIKIDF